MKDFDDVYNINMRVLSTETGERGKLETYGKDLEKVQAYCKDRPRKVWTVVDSEDGDDLIVIAGYHYVNRVLYLISTTEWQDENEQYKY